MSNRLANITENQVLDNIWPNDKYLSPFLNKVNMMRILDISYLNLAGPDVIPNRDHVFHVTFPAEWKTTDLLTLFAPFGSIQVSWTSDTTAYVSLRELVPNAKSVIMSTLNCSSVYQITPYEAHKKMELILETSAFDEPSLNQSGITPMTEKLSPFPEVTKAGKRSASPDQEKYKRTKSVTDESPKEKLFGDQSWD